MCPPKKAMPKPIAASPAPQRDAASVDPTKLAEQSRQLAQKRQGVFGNIKTTPFGDTSYGTSSVARFG